MGEEIIYSRILSERPTTNRIKEFVALWEGKKNTERFEVTINGAQANLCDGQMFGMDFRAIRKEEELLEAKFDILKKQSKDTLDEGFIIEIVRLLDSIYSTQLKYPTIFAIRLHKLLQAENDLLEKIKSPKESQCFQEEAKCVDEIARIKDPDSKWELNNAYSFATKFCNRINPSRFPIYDSYVDSLLWYYRFDIVDKNFRRKELKNYSKFIQVYNCYREAWHLDAGLNYKQIDVFMWTYGKAIKKLQEGKTKKFAESVNPQIYQDLEKLNMNPSDKYVGIQ